MEKDDRQPWDVDFFFGRHLWKWTAWKVKKSTHWKGKASYKRVTNGMKKLILHKYRVISLQLYRYTHLFQVTYICVISPLGAHLVGLKQKMLSPNPDKPRKKVPWVIFLPTSAEWEETFRLFWHMPWIGLGHTSELDPLVTWRFRFETTTLSWAADVWNAAMVGPGKQVTSCRTIAPPIGAKKT